jgi:hypothetical protein
MVFCFVVPAQAGTQGFQSLAPCSLPGASLGPRFRGGDDVRGLRDWITASVAGVHQSGRTARKDGPPQFFAVR